MLRLISRLRNPLRSLPQTGTYQHHIGSPLLPPSNCHLSHPFSSSRSTPDEEGGDGPESSLGASVVGHDQDRPPRLFVVQPRLRPESTLRAKLSEALNLANSLEEPRDGRYMEAFEEKKTPPHSIVQNPLARSGGHADTFFGKGTVENIKREILALDSEPGPDAIFVNSVLSGIQQRNLERTWGMPVIDRVGLIIEIFNAHAQTKEAKLQSELAALIYKRTRLVRLRGPGGRLTFGTMGESEVVSAKGKGSGGRGFLSGAGESEIQLQRHRIQQRREQLLHEIEEVRRTRALQRDSRKKHGSDGLATIAIVGYTNAGKSTLVSALSRNDVYSDDRLFATVDPRLRSVILPSGRKVLLSDTVGFISDLPIQLIEAFHATLEEVVHADLLVHVLDSSASNVDDQRLTVLDVLKQIGVSDEKIQNMVEVWNKIDLLEKKSMTAEMLDDIENSANDEDQDEWSTSSENELVSEQGVTGDVEDDLLLEDCEGEDFKWDEDRKINSKLCLEVHKSEVDAADGGESMSCSGGEPVKESMPSAEQIPKEPDTESLDTMKDGSALTSLEDDNNHLCRGSKADDVVSSTIMLGDIRRIQTSAVTGVGLQEVLGIMDEKLSIIDQRLHSQNANSSTGASLFERKWRPSYGRASDKETATV